MSLGCISCQRASVDYPRWGGFFNEIVISTLSPDKTLDLKADLKVIVCPCFLPQRSSDENAEYR
jgi:hypothetical protein